MPATHGYQPSTSLVTDPLDYIVIVLTLLFVVPFSYKLMHHLKPFPIVVLNGEITVYSVDSPNGFEW